MRVPTQATTQHKNAQLRTGARSRYSLFTLMILLLIGAGITGFANFEGMGVMDAFHATIAAITFSSNPDTFSSQGKLLNTALALSAVAVVGWAFVNFHSLSLSLNASHFGDKAGLEGTSETLTPSAENALRFLPNNEHLILREIRVAKKSHLAGKRKLDILRTTGTVVFGVKKGDSFQLNVPFKSTIPAGSVVLFLGTASQLKEVQREASASSR